MKGLFPCIYKQKGKKKSTNIAQKASLPVCSKLIRKSSHNCASSLEERGPKGGNSACKQVEGLEESI